MATQQTVRPISPDTRSWQVLAVDDRADNLIIVTKALRFHGATVQPASNGDECLRLLETFTPSFVLLDLSMPNLDGWDVLAHIRANPSTAPIPVIALTAHAMLDDRDKVLTAGFNGYITKPYDIFSLAQQIRSWLCNPE